MSSSAGCDRSPPYAYTDGEGAYVCCAAGDGEDCCEGLSEQNCFQYGGVYGECAELGELIEGKVPCALCCDRLIPVTNLVVSDGGSGSTCELEGPISLQICLPCGDGVCSSAENACACPEDCDG